MFKGVTLLFGNIAFWIILFYFAAPSLPGWATKNWLPTLYAENLDIPMAEAGPISTITIAVSSFIGVILGGLLSDRWVSKDIRGRIYTGAIGLGLTIPALLLLGLGNGFISIIGAGFLFGVGFGMFDANNMPILCQFVSAKYRATAYGIMNMTGVFAGAVVTSLFGNGRTVATWDWDLLFWEVLYCWLWACSCAFFVRTRIIWNDTNHFPDRE